MHIAHAVEQDFFLHQLSCCLYVRHKRFRNRDRKWLFTGELCKLEPDGW